MIKYKGQVASLAPLAMFASVSIVAVTTSLANAETIDDARTTTQNLATNEDLTIANTGSVIIGTEIDAVRITFDGYTNAVTNLGTVAVRPNPGPAASISDIEAFSITGNYGAGFSFTNSGTIEVDLSESPNSNFDISGLRASQGGTIDFFENDENGIIKVSGKADGTNSEIDVYGVYFPANSTVSGDLVNRGLIDLDAQARDIDISGFGGSFDVGGNVINSGQVLIDALVTGDSGEAEGFNLGSVGGDITNSGTVQVHMTSTDSYGYLYGFDTSTVSGSVTNSGTVDVAVLAGESEISAMGFHILGDGIAENFTNSGTINALGDLRPYGTGYTRAFVIGADLRGVGGKILNSGSVSVEAYGTDEPRGSSSGDGTLAVGFFVGNSKAGDDLGNGFENQGQIKAKSVTSTTATAYGLYVKGAVLAGGVTNSGSLDIDASGYAATAAGVFVDGDVSGDIKNSGSTSVSAIADDVARSFGFRVTGNVDGSVSNSGSMTIAANGGGSTRFGTGASAYGIYIDGNVSSGVTNSGRIQIDATAEENLTAAGIFVGGDILSGGINNSGQIVINAKDINGSDSQIGMVVKGDVIGNAINSGTIVVTADSFIGDSITGFEIFGKATGNVVNRGLIDIYGNFSTAEGEAFGMYAKGNNGGTSIDGDFRNEGTIRIDIVSDSENFGYGMIADNDVTGTVSNSGLIDLNLVDRAMPDGSSANGYGIRLGGDVLTEISNSGVIKIYAENTEFDDGAAAYGIYSDHTSLSGDIKNTGSIFVEQIGAVDTNKNAYGIYVSNFDGNLENYGLISAKGDNDGKIAGVYFENFSGSIDKVGAILSEDTDGGPDSYAIYLGSGTGSVSIDTTDSVQGLIRVDAHTATLTSVNGSGGYFEFEDASPGTAEYTTIVEAGADEWFVIDEGGSNPIYTTYGQEVSISQSTVVTQIVDLNDYLVDLSAVLGADVPDGLATAKAGSAIMPFVRAEATFSNTDNLSGLDVDSNVYSFQVGALSATQNGGNFGVMLSAFSSDTDVFSNSTGLKDSEADGTGFGAELAYTQAFDIVTLTLGAHFGQLDVDQERFNVGGTATSKSDNRWYGLSAAASTDIAMFEGWAGNVSAKITATQFTFGGYSESGSSPALATVGERSATRTQGELGYSMSKQIDPGTFKLGASIYSSSWSGDDTASVTIATTTQDVTMLNREGTGVELFTGLEDVSVGNGLFDFGGSLNVDGDGHRALTLSANYRFEF